MAVGGGLVGIATAYALLDVVLAVVPPSIPRLAKVSINGAVVA